MAKQHSDDHDHAHAHSHGHDDQHGRGQDDAHDHDDGHAHGHGLFHRHRHGAGGHEHTHFHVDSRVVSNAEATRALLISMAGLLLTAALQLGVFFVSGSTGLLADTIHNFGDALTSLPLWIAFNLSRRPPTARYTYGLNRSEDIAGLVIVAVIAFSAIVAGYESVVRLIHLQAPTHLCALAIAAIIGFAGNELVAQYRIRVGTRMGSAALVADGQHARVDGLTSLAVLIGAAGAWIGIPVLDPLVGIAITLMILGIVRDSARAVFRRLLDGIEPETIAAIRTSAAHVPGVKGVNDIRARWAGHAVMVDLSIAVGDELSVRDAHTVAGAVEHALLHVVPHLREVLVHIDPESLAGAGFHGHDAHHAHHLAH